MHNFLERIVINQAAVKCECLEILVFVQNFWFMLTYAKKLIQYLHLTYSTHQLVIVNDIVYVILAKSYQDFPGMKRSHLPWKYCLYSL